MRFYVATTLANHTRATEVADLLTELGHHCTYRWMDLPKIESWSWEEAAKRAKAELDAVHDSDIVICLLPGGYGMHTELGAALATPGTIVFLWASSRIETDHIGGGLCVFHRHPGVTIVEGCSIGKLALKVHATAQRRVNPITVDGLDYRGRTAVGAPDQVFVGIDNAAPGGDRAYEIRGRVDDGVISIEGVCRIMRDTGDEHLTWSKGEEKK